MKVAQTAASDFDYCLLRIAYYLLPIAYCLLLIAYFTWR
jgi:hypothetical protein